MDWKSFSHYHQSCLTAPHPHLLQIALRCFRAETTLPGILPLSFCEDSTAQSCSMLSLVAIRTHRQTCVHLRNGLENPGEAQLGGAWLRVGVVLTVPYSAACNTCDAGDCPKWLYENSLL